MEYNGEINVQKVDSIDKMDSWNIEPKFKEIKKGWNDWVDFSKHNRTDIRNYEDFKDAISNLTDRHPLVGIILFLLVNRKHGNEILKKWIMDLPDDKLSTISQVLKFFL